MVFSIQDERAIKLIITANFIIGVFTVFSLLLCALDIISLFSLLIGGILIPMVVAILTTIFVVKCASGKSSKIIVERI